MTGKRLARNVLWNLLGSGVPMLIALLAIPRIIALAGAQRFGLLAIVWMLIGYFSLFDMGLGRALTKMTAERLARQRTAGLPELARTALLLMLLLGLAASALIACAAQPIIVHLLEVPVDLRAEGILSLRILSASLPFVILSAALVGILEAHQRFDQINLVRTPMGVLTFLAPWAAFQITAELPLATAALALIRLMAFIVYALQCARTVPGLLATATIERAALRPLVFFGGWLTVSNVIGPLMVYFDRFLVGAVLGMTAVTAYVTPYEVVTRLWVLPAAVIDVLFPALAAAYVADRVRTKVLFGNSINLIALVMVVPAVLVVPLAPELLRSWLGGEYSSQSGQVARWLILGVYANSICRVPLVLILGTGKPDWVAKLHLAELLPYVAALWFLVGEWGVVGASVAWTLRVAVDTVLLFWLCWHHVPYLRLEVARGLALAVSVPAALFTTTLIESLTVRASVAAVGTIVAVFVGARQLHSLMNSRRFAAPPTPVSTHVGG